MAVCDDLRLGGTLTGSGITGGTTINGTTLAVEDWSSILGHTGISFTPVEVAGRPSSYLVGDGLPLSRYPTLNMRIKSQGECDALDTPADRLLENTDTFMALIARPGGNYLEVDLPDATSRFIHVTALTPALVSQSSQVRRINVPLFSQHAYWHAGGTQSTDTISGADTLVVGGNVTVYDAVLVFAGDGTFTHSGLGWSITIAGSTGAVTVDLGARTVKQAGIDADQLLTRTDNPWGWFISGNNAVTADVSVSVTWRNQYA